MTFGHEGGHYFNEDQRGGHDEEGLRRMLNHQAVIAELAECVELLIVGRDDADWPDCAARGREAVKAALGRPPRTIAPGECDVCGAKARTDAEKFVHACVHSGDYPDLGRLPFALFPAVARMMAEYKRSV